MQTEYSTVFNTLHYEYLIMSIGKKRAVVLFLTLLLVAIFIYSVNIPIDDRSLVDDNQTQQPGDSLSETEKETRTKRVQRKLEYESVVPLRGVETIPVTNLSLPPTVTREEIAEGRIVEQTQEYALGDSGFTHEFRRYPLTQSESIQTTTVAWERGEAIETNLINGVESSKIYHSRTKAYRVTFRSNNQYSYTKPKSAELLLNRNFLRSSLESIEEYKLSQTTDKSAVMLRGRASQQSLQISELQKVTKYSKVYKAKTAVLIQQGGVVRLQTVIRGRSGGRVVTTMYTYSVSDMESESTVQPPEWVSQVERTKSDITVIVPTGEDEIVLRHNGGADIPEGAQVTITSNGMSSNITTSTRFISGDIIRFDNSKNKIDIEESIRVRIQNNTNIFYNKYIYIT